MRAGQAASLWEDKAQPRVTEETWRGVKPDTTGRNHPREEAT